MEQSQMVSDQLDAATSGEHEVVETRSEDQVPYSSHQRVIGEIKRERERRRSLEKELETYKQEKLEKEGRHEDVIISLREANSALEKTIEEREARFAMTQVKNQLHLLGKDHGCRPERMDDVIKLLGDGVIGNVEYDKETFAANKDQLLNIVEMGKKKVPEWFKSQAKPVSDGVPAKGDYTPKKYNPAGKSSEELQNRLKKEDW